VSATADQPGSQAARVLLRLPRGLHDQLSAAAKEQGISVNTLLVALLAGGVGWSLDNSTGDTE